MVPRDQAVLLAQLVGLGSPDLRVLQAVEQQVLAGQLALVQRDHLARQEEPGLLDHQVPLGPAVLKAQRA